MREAGISEEGLLCKPHRTPTLLFLYYTQSLMLGFHLCIRSLVRRYQNTLLSAHFCLFLRGHRSWSPRLMDAVW